MIEKKIHYCWFGGNELPTKAKRCIKSWKKYFPDYEIIEWNEKNFDINFNNYAKEAYLNKKYAFFTDVARLYIIYHNGGIYFDVEVEVIKKFDNDILSNEAFFGLETENNVNTGIGFGAEADNRIVRDMIREYDELLDGQHGIIGCPILNTKALVRKGLIQNGKKQNVEGVVIYPSDYFNPYDDPTGMLTKTENTYSIHWYGKSWMDKKTVIGSKLLQPVHRIFGKELLKKFK